MMQLESAWLGTVEYGDALQRQEAARDHAIRTGGGRVMGLEHPPVITLGMRGGEVDAARATAAGYAVWRTRRGGLATCHEPGQLVGYLVVDARPAGVRFLVEWIEEVLIDFLASRGVAGGRRAHYPGVWVAEDGRPAKIAAVGLQVRQGWSLHGFALNLGNDLRGFDLINPCGISGAGVTSVARLLGDRAAPSPESAWLSLAPVLTGAGRFAKPRNPTGA